MEKKALLAQSKITKHKSVAAAMKVLRCPTANTTQGNLRTTLEKLHPQVGDPVDSHQQYNFDVMGAASFTPLSEFERNHLDHRRPIADEATKEDQPTNHPDKPYVEFKPEDYIGRVRRGDNATAGGLNGVNYLIMKIIFKHNDKLAQNYTKYLNTILKGKINPNQQEILNASRGIGLPKNEQGDIRPIAIGNILLRMLGSMALRTIVDDIHSFFMPIQFGVGVRSGCELMISAITNHLKLNPNHICVSCDS